ncbi:MAG TPA: copper transporter [Syntrophomonadaceae bacterium]|nr:copper transporter [Syntrophomonadaceae bacterium]
MIDIKYHIASIVAVFLALGLGILIGSTIVGDELLVDQQKKILDRLENQFEMIREREVDLVLDNEYKTELISNYENYSLALLPPLVQDRLNEEKIAVVVTGNTDIPSGLVNSITIAGAQVVSKTVVLSNLKLSDNEVNSKLLDYYNIEETEDFRDILRKNIAGSVTAVLLNQGDQGIMEFLQESDVINFTGSFDEPISKVIILGGTNSLETYFAKSFDQSLIENLINGGIKVFGVEKSSAVHSYMADYQENNITTIDNIDMSPGQVGLVFAMEGEPGNYGIKSTAEKFMPSLPVNFLGSEAR